MPVAARWPYRLYFDWQWNPASARYGERSAQGEEAWLYTCNSAVFLDYPALFIDTGASDTRVIPWLAFRHGFTGLLYWQSVSSYGQSGGPWETPLVMLANGDGNLLYPGVPGQPDVATHQPIPSLRLQVLRDGMEDYEYLVLASRVMGLNDARAVAARVADSSLRWAHDSATIEAIREDLGLRIEETSVH
jgi:glycosyl hydrolase family 123